IYSLYVMFYPQLVTGPIERPQNLLRQLREHKIFKDSNLIEGLRLILFGLFTKMVIADNLGEYVDQIYSNPASYNTVSILIGLFFYSFQIYCDFYGYSTIAVGCAKTMGFSLTDNFKNPYMSRSIGEFWQRWHISLSTWFRDYVYFSLGGNKVIIQRWVINILIVFVLSGFWHGANWTFIIWGLMHGLVYVVETLLGRKIQINNSDVKSSYNLLSILNIIKTFIIVSLIWVFFRAKDLSQVKVVFKSIFSNLNIENKLNIDPTICVFLLGFIALDIMLFNNRFDTWCNNKTQIVRWCIYTLLAYLIIAFSSVSNFPFIYFQF
ncbi:MAG: MBOAT family O-acyltransferase, partial [Saprospiraceae bacterium]